MKLSTIFRLTRERMQAGGSTKFDLEGSPYICDNIKALLNFDNVIEEADAERSRNIIETRIEGAFSVEGWLLRNGHITEFEFRNYTPEHKKKLQDYRHAWLESLETEFAAIGD